MKRFKVFSYSFVSIFALLWLFPFAVMLITITKNSDQFVENFFWYIPPIQEIPINIFNNALNALFKGDILAGMVNSLLYASVAAIVAAIITSLAGYALVHLNVKYPQSIFFVLFGGNLLPYQMFLLPLYLGSVSIGLYDTRIALLLVYIGICVPFALLVQRNYASNVPGELLEAARLDGCNSLEIYTKIFLPLTKSAFLAVFVLDFTWVWNNLIFGMVLTEDVRPIMSTISRLTPSGRGYIGPPVIIMGSILASIPTMIIFVALHRYFIEGFAIGTSK